MSNIQNEVDPFSETPLELQKFEESAEVTEEQNSMIETEDVANDLTYAELLTPMQVRWFYRDGVDKRWVEFCGYDSLRIENAWRNYQDLISSNIDTLNNLPHIEKIVVKGGMYDVEIDKMKCISIYCPVLHTEHFPEFHVDWHSINDVILHSEYRHSKLMRSVTSKLGFAKTTGYQLRRGYKVAAVMEDKPHDIDHIVFVVHGIGQKRDTGKIIRNTTSFRDCVDWLKQKYFPNSNYRVEFFPVEWRSSLKLDGDIVEAITPYSVLSIRHLLNSSAMDILYYTSPLYGGEVRAGLQKELNRLYFMFASRHPGWKGKVSILAHSLGCVIVYDIVTGWMGPDTRPPSPETQEVLLQRLQFSIENLFCLGSPLSVFLALRTRSPSNRTDVMPQGLCKRFYNIFHWSDPVAYRMEPLLERGYSKIEPVLIPSYGEVEGQQMEQPPPPISVADQTFSPTETDEREENPDMSNRTSDKGWSLWGLVRAGWNAKEDASTPIQPGQELSQRLDYVLRASLGRNYLYTVAAHTTYWSNYDVAYFVLTRLFPTLES
ncbi:phospholipase DDHD1 isoform X2 [Halictus rubicundus]|uniref:phospholipase DDHD1 isoform X2 n=1 Tax=Halictus rubicundus TaxID=77578 RepID=UPI0040372D01